MLSGGNVPMQLYFTSVTLGTFRHELRLLLDQCYSSIYICITSSDLAVGGAFRSYTSLQMFYLLAKQFNKTPDELAETDVLPFLG